MGESEHINWFDHDRPPMVDAIRLGPDLYAVWFKQNGQDESHPHLWHWCTKVNWIAKRKAEGGPDPSDPKVDQPQWMLAGSAGHQLVSKEPLSLSPSVYWPDCCGMHGFVTGGVYTSV